MRLSLLYLHRPLSLLLLASTLTTSTLADPPTQPAQPVSLAAASPAPSQEASQLNNAGLSEQIYAQGDTVEIAHPYNPKPLGVIPPGWTPEPIANYSVRNPNVTLKNGRIVTIECPIYALVPDVKSHYHPFREPGFDSEKGNNQTGILGNILTHYIAQNDELGRQIDAALLQIQHGFAATEAKTDPTGDASRLLIDKPPNQAANPADTPPAGLAASSAGTLNPAPTATPADSTPSATPAAKKKHKQTTHTTRRKDKPKSTATPTPTPAKKFLGLFPIHKGDMPQAAADQQ